MGANKVLLYGSETWRTTKHITNKLQTFTNHCLRRILKIFWPNRISNTSLWELDHNGPIKILFHLKTCFPPGLLKQIDAGGDEIVVGVNSHDHIYCLNKGSSIQPCREKSEWTQIPGGLKYYSCGPISCWGVNSKDQIYIKKGVTPEACGGVGDWQRIGGALSMIEVGQDGSVYGVNSGGNVYLRTGITTDQPEGTGWTHINFFKGQAKHVSFDLGHLWIILKNDQIHDCTDFS
ncbi:fish-egg lectin-like [Engraulis encrasicolus]|uniref:fish-egg lectin-like n=1 Tax=Engraulis encrasicolus TaxID=184585 RepID=UPI002FD31444